MKEKWLTLFRHLFWSVEGMDWTQRERKDKSPLCLRFHSHAPSSPPSDLDDEDSGPLVLFLSSERHSRAPGPFSTDILSLFLYKLHCILRLYLNIKHDIPFGALGKIRAWWRLSEACSLTGCGLFFSQSSDKHNSKPECWRNKSSPELEFNELEGMFVCINKRGKVLWMCLPDVEKIFKKHCREHKVNKIANIE